MTVCCTCAVLCCVVLAACVRAWRLRVGCAALAGGKDMLRVAMLGCALCATVTDVPAAALEV